MTALKNSRNQLKSWKQLKRESVLKSTIYPALILLCLVLLMILSGCVTKPTDHSPMCISRVQSLCQRPIEEPLDLNLMDAAIRENAIRYGECAEKVLMLMQDLNVCRNETI